MLFMSGCTLKGTTNEITDTTSNVTGTTSGRTWFNEDGVLDLEHRLIAFMTLNQANVEQDLARGQGEYVTSLGTLLELSNDRQTAFHAKAQGAFEAIIASDHDARLEQLRMLAR
jgi:hypothetical protein